MHYVTDEDDLFRMKYCPLCGEELLSIYIGDYTAHTECLECGESIGFYILEECIARGKKFALQEMGTLKEMTK